MVKFLWFLCLPITMPYVRSPLQDLTDSDLRCRQSSSQEIKHCGVGRCYLVAGLCERRHVGERKRGKSRWLPSSFLFFFSSLLFSFFLFSSFLLQLGNCRYMKNFTELFPKFTLQRTNPMKLDNDICPYCRVYPWVTTTLLSILSISYLNTT